MKKSACRRSAVGTLRRVAATDGRQRRAEARREERGHAATLPVRRPQWDLCRATSLVPKSNDGDVIVPRLSSLIVDCETPQRSAISCCVMPAACSAAIRVGQSIGSLVEHRNSASVPFGKPIVNIGKLVSMATARPSGRTDFGQRMYEARTAAGLSQVEVCKRLGISQSTLSEAAPQWLASASTSAQLSAPSRA